MISYMTLSLILLAKFERQQLFLECELVFHLEIALGQAAVLAKDVSYYTGKSFPFLFFSLLPVVLPEIIVRLKVRHVVNLDCHEPTSCQNGEVGTEAEDIHRRRDFSGVPVFNEQRLD